MSKTNLSELFQNDDWKKELTDVIRVVVKEEVEKASANFTHVCRLDITDQEAQELPHFYRMIGDIGDGETAKGLKLMRENHEWMASQRKLGQKISSAFITVIIASAVSAIGYAIWAGIRSLLTK